MSAKSARISRYFQRAVFSRPSARLRKLTRLQPTVPDRLRGGLLLLAALALTGLIALLDYGSGPYLSFGIFYLIPVAACAWWGGFAEGLLLSLAGAVAWHAVESVQNPLLPLHAGLWNGIVRFSTLALTSSLVARLHAGVLRERLLARTDPLTGAANGRTFYQAVAVESERARRAGRPLTLAYADLDDFKQLNDRLGHAVGDEALLHVVQTIQHHLRGSDLLARLGGDEFALLLPEVEPGGAIALLRRVREALSHELARKGWPVTLSIGSITFLRPTSDVDQMIQHVDARMYAAKRKGKGCVDHAIVEKPAHPREWQGHALERRATARILCDRPARLRVNGQESSETTFVTIRDISAGGVCVCLDTRLAPDTLLILEPLAPGVKVLLARVVRVVSEGGGWQHGCELPARLGAEDLGLWLGSEGGVPNRPLATLDERAPELLAPGRG